MADPSRQFGHEDDSVELTVQDKAVSNVQSLAVYNSSDAQSTQPNREDGTQAPENENGNGVFGHIAQWIFHRDYLDRALERHHITSNAPCQLKDET